MGLMVKRGESFIENLFHYYQDLVCTWDVKEYLKEKKPEPSVKRLIIKHLVKTVREMHACGVNYRDCYPVHFLIQMPFDSKKGTEGIRRF